MSQKKQRKRRPPYDGDPIMVTKRSTWGTVADGKRNERIRELKNQIHDLETELAGAQVSIKNVTLAKHEVERRLEAAVPQRIVDALRTVCLLPISTSVELGIDDALLRLCVWLAEIEFSAVATGNSEATGS